MTQQRNISYWQKGCDAARKNIPMRNSLTGYKAEAMAQGKRFTMNNQKSFMNGYMYGSENPDKPFKVYEELK